MTLVSSKSRWRMIMQKFTCMLFLLLLTLLTSCSANKEEKSTNLDQGPLDVEITLPAFMFEGENLDTIIANAEKNGIPEVVKHEDGSLTYKMSKEKHEELMNETGKGITDSIVEMKNSGAYSSIKDITHHDSFSEFTLLVDKAAYENSMDSFATFSLGMSGTMYQLFNGTNPDQYKVTVFVKDQDTQEIFDKIVYPDAFE